MARHRGHARTVVAALAACLALTLPVATAHAGRLVETGEPADVSCFYEPALGACGFLKATLDYVRTGAPDPSKPILLFDKFPDITLQAIKSAYGGSPPFAIDEEDPSLFDFKTTPITTARFSAIVVASDGTCCAGPGSLGPPGDLNQHGDPALPHPWFRNDPVPNPLNEEVPASLSPMTPDSDALVAPTGHDAINSFYNAGGGILVGSGGDNGDGHQEDLYYDFVSAPRGTVFSGDPTALTPLALGIGLAPVDVARSGCPMGGPLRAPSGSPVWLECPYNAFFPLPAGSSLRVAETDNAGDPVTLFQDTDPPVTTITSTPQPIVVSSGPTSASFSFGASENHVTFECRLDSSAFTACSSPITYGGLGEGTHVFTVRSVDAAGNVEAAPPAASWLIAFDRDGDGFTRFSNPPDCNDGDPHIFPGAPEAPGGHIDTDCDGILDPFPTIRPNVTFSVRFTSRFTRFTNMVVSSVPAGAAVDISCVRRRHCPFPHMVVTVKKANGRVSLTKVLHGRHLPVGLVLAIRITRTQTIGGFESLTMRRSSLPRTKIQCMNPGTRTPQNVCPRYT